MEPIDFMSRRRLFLVQDAIDRYGTHAGRRLAGREIKKGRGPVVTSDRRSATSLRRGLKVKPQGYLGVWVNVQSTRKVLTIIPC